MTHGYGDQGPRTRDLALLTVNAPASTRGLGGAAPPLYGLSVSAISAGRAPLPRAEGAGPWDLFGGLPTLDDLSSQPAGATVAHSGRDTAAPADNPKPPEAATESGTAPAGTAPQAASAAPPTGGDLGALSPVDRSLTTALATFHPGPGGPGGRATLGAVPAAAPAAVIPTGAATLPVKGTGGDASGNPPPPPDGGSHDSDRILEGLTVPAETGAGVTSQTVLTAGVTYTLVAWGDFQYGATAADRGDAQYRNFPQPTSYATDGITPIGVTLSGVTVLATQPIWGAYRPDHTYRVQVRGQGTALHASFQDIPSAYSTHHGSISVDIIPGPDAPADTPPVQCCGQKGDLSQTAPGADGGYDAGRGYGDGNIRYFDGLLRLEADDLGTGGFGTAWGLSRTWANLPATAWSTTPKLGSGMNDSQQPIVISLPPPDGSIYLSTVVVYTSAINAHYFYQMQGGAFMPAEFEGDSLVYVGGGSPYYDYTDSTGDQMLFNPIANPPLAPMGTFRGYIDKAGNGTTLTYNGQGQLTDVLRSDPANGTSETYHFNYLSSGNNTGLVADVTVTRQPPIGSPFTVRKAVYTYYDPATPRNGGTTGELMTAQIQEPDPNNNNQLRPFQTYYYRYNTGTEPFAGGLKYVFTSPSYDRLIQALNPMNGDPSTLTDAQVQPFADASYTYYDTRQVASVTLQGAGCSCSQGQGTYSYQYILNSAPSYQDGYNSWLYETIEGLPDGSARTVFANYKGETMLSVFQSGGQQWETFYKYDDAGRTLWVAHPSAIQYDGQGRGYDSTSADLLVADPNGHYTYLKDNQGLIDVNDYYTDTTATETVPGHAAGYLAHTRLQWGQAPAGGQPKQVLQRTYLYYAHQAGVGGSSVTVYPVATDTAYQDNAGLVPELTKYTYTAWAGALAQTVVTQKPLIPVSQNGPGGTSYDVQTTTYDNFGNMTQVTDPDGKVTHYSYDRTTGAVTAVARDATGLNLTTAMTVDAYGRDTAIQDPNGNVTYVVYNDFTHETRTYPGWNGTTHRPTGPTRLTREDRTTATVYDETLTMSAAPALDASNLPKGTEAISQVQSLRRDLTNNSGQVVEHDAYQDLGNGYVANQAVIPGAHYNATVYGYDDRGRQEKVATANGTLQRTVYDGLGRVVSTWVGTNDTTTTQVNLTGAFTRTGIMADNTMFSSTGGLDGRGHAYSASQLTSPVTWNTLPFTLGPAGMADAVVASGQALTLPAGEAAALSFLATGVRGDGTGQLNQNFVVTYTDGSTQTFTQSLSDWTSSATFSGEDNAVTMAYWDNADGSRTTQPVYLHAYRFALNPAKDVQSLTLPTNADVVLLAATLTNADWSPANTAPSNMLQVSADYYDQATIGGPSGVGDGNLTETIQYPHGTSDPANPPRATNLFYDWRDRLVYGKEGYQATEDTTTHRPIIYQVYDNLDEVTSAQQYDGDTVNTVSYGQAGSPQFGTPLPPAAGRLRAQTDSRFDAQGRVFQAKTYSVDTNGTLAAVPLVTNDWYNHRGLLVKTSAPGGLVQKLAYDGAGRQTFVYTTDAAGDSGPGTAQGWSDAQQVNAANNVLTQTQSQYDGAGNVIFQTTWDRYHNSAYTGDLSQGAGVARASFVGRFYDAANRLTNEVDYGNNGGTFLSGRPTSIDLRGAGAALRTDDAYVADTVQTVALSSGTSGGTFTLTFNSQTATIPFNASAALVQSLLVPLLGMGNVTVTGATGGAMTPGGPWAVRFTGALAGQNEPLLAADSSGLTGGSATVTLTSQAGDAGRVQAVTDPRGLVTKTDYDLLGRTVRTVAAFTASPLFSDPNWNQATEYSYDADNHISILSAYPGDGSIQQTQYTYTANPADSSWVSSNDQLTLVQYPDKTTGRPSTLASDRETYLYDNLGETRAMTQRTGTVHNYAYDVLRRLTRDSVSSFGAGVDQTVGALGAAYDTYGNAATFTSYAPNGTTIVNQVQRSFNGLGQLTAETQYHGDPANQSTPRGTVSYAYSGPASGMNYSRLASITYPNMRQIDYLYGGGNDTLDDTISRLTTIKDDSSGTILETSIDGANAYSDYLGLGTVVQRDHPQANLNLTYIGTPGGDAGDQYVGLDRFGRVVDQNWQVAGVSTDRFQYGYDADGNRLYRANLVTQALQPPLAFDELYHPSGSVDTYNAQGQLQTKGYDVLNQMTAFSRGTLSADHKSISGTSHTQSWTLDALGNWTQFTADGTPQTRTTNRQNELTQINGTVNLTYDNNGNTTQDDQGHRLSYDAWNRLVAVNTSGNPTMLLASYGYDALGRRIQAGPTSFNLTDRYYSDEWQVLEEDISGAMTQQYVWSPVYVDALIDRDSAGGQRLYVQQDANWNVTALVDATTRNVVERFIYDPYGKPTDAAGQNIGALNADWTTKTGGDGYGWVYLHQGGHYEASTGLYNFRNRDFSPTLGRWMQQDPLGYVAGDANLYRSEVNSPASWTDFSGLDSKIEWRDTGERKRFIVGMEFQTQWKELGRTVKFTEGECRLYVDYAEEMQTRLLSRLMTLQKRNNPAAQRKLEQEIEKLRKQASNLEAKSLEASRKSAGAYTAGYALAGEALLFEAAVVGLGFAMTVSTPLIPILWPLAAVLQAQVFALGAASLALQILGAQYGRDAAELGYQASQASKKADALKDQIRDHKLPQDSRWVPSGPLERDPKWSDWKPTGNLTTVSKAVPLRYCLCLGNIFTIPVDPPKSRSGVFNLPQAVPVLNIPVLVPDPRR